MLWKKWNILTKMKILFQKNRILVKEPFFPLKKKVPTAKIQSVPLESVMFSLIQKAAKMVFILHQENDNVSESAGESTKWLPANVKGKAQKYPTERSEY